MEQNGWLAIGIMSGTSLDGVDICLCHFNNDTHHWTFEIKHAHTYPYPADLHERLIFNNKLSATELLKLDNELGLYFGQLVNNFIDKYAINRREIDVISSHGHTLYHQPAKGITLQIGNGPQIFATTGIPLVCDFRKQDVALGGQGAPLVPIGDKHLFGGFDACINLGGFANISFEENEERLAFDIAPVNFATNRLAQKLGKAYDENGAIARNGQLNEYLLSSLNQLEYYQHGLPKSLGAEWVWEVFNPTLWHYSDTTENYLRTVTEHVSVQIANTLNQYQIKQCLVTGGGAYNGFLIERIQAQTLCELIIPERVIIENKEALIFAFMGVLRLTGETNILKSVTGARTNHSSGIIYGL